MQERRRLDTLRIFAGAQAPNWPRHIQWYHGIWNRNRGELPCFLQAAMQSDNEQHSDAARKMYAEVANAPKKCGDGHH